MINITINGERREVSEKKTVQALLLEAGLQPEATVVERNGNILDRADYEAVQLADGDALELVRFVGGG